jgi:hypothetical protein
MKYQSNIKIKNLLKKILDGKEFVYSFEDTSWDGIIIAKYTIEYHIEVEENVRGTGSDAVAGISVIIDKILLDGGDFYYDWVDSGYSENVWYIDYLHDHLVNEVLDVFPFSIYPTFYGHDEER